MDAFTVKNWLVTLLIAIAVGAASFGAFYALNCEPADLKSAVKERDALEWLRVEFKLTDQQYAAIKQLHAQYGTVCAEHCSAIMAAQKRHAPAEEVARLENACVQSMTDHFHRVAALMAPKEGARYLAMVLPRVQDYDHRGAPNVEVRR